MKNIFDILFVVMYNDPMFFCEEAIRLPFTAGEVEPLGKGNLASCIPSGTDCPRIDTASERGSARLRREAVVKGEELLAAAVKEAKKRAEILYGVARADGEKRKAAIQQETRQEQQELQDKAKARYALAAREMERIVLGHPRRR